MTPTTNTKDKPAADTNANNAAAQQAAPPATQPTGGNLMVVDYGKDAGAGLQNISTDEISIPFIGKLHYVCPQIDASDAKFIPGAKPGMLLASSTNEVFDGLTDGMDFIPCHRDKNFVEFKIDRGGFVAQHAVDDPMVLNLLKEQGRFKKLLTKNGTELIETKYIYGLFMPSPDYVFAGVLGLSSKQIKRYTAFMDTVTRIKVKTPSGEMVNPPMWAHRWHLKTVPDSNAKGKFFSYHLAMVNGATAKEPLAARLDRSKPEENDLYDRAKALYENIQAGRTTVDYEGAAEGAAKDDDIPF